MFGYVNINKPELKVKDFYKYKAYYCGLCRMLKEKYGFLGQLTLTYDMTFLIILLSSLYETENENKEHRCMVHPIKKQKVLLNDITEYAADMNIALTYHHFIDDWQDEKKVSGYVGTKAFRRAYQKVEKQYPRQCKVIIRSLELLKQCEKDKIHHIDNVSRCFGELMGELLVYQEDGWEDIVRRLGFFLGKFIYIMDAYEDLEQDIAKGCYNPLEQISKEDDYEQQCNHILTMMIAECASEFEKLPCLQDEDILRNIIYEGVWMKYKDKQMNNAGKKEQK